MGERPPSLQRFFNYLGFSCFVLSIRTEIITHPSVEVLKSLWYTFGYCFTAGIYIALAIMFTEDVYHYFKRKYIKRKNDNSI